MGKKLTFHYHGPAYELLNGKHYILATDEVGKPVIFDYYREAVSAKQAGCYIKLDLRKKYKPQGKVKLNAKFMSVKGSLEDVKKIKEEVKSYGKKIKENH